MPLGPWKDASGEANEERVVVAVAENMRDVAQAEAVRLSEELEGMGHSLSPSYASHGRRSLGHVTHSFDVSNSCWCRFEGGSLSSRRATPRASGGGR